MVDKATLRGKLVISSTSTSGSVPQSSRPGCEQQHATAAAGGLDHQAADADRASADGPTPAAQQSAAQQLEALVRCVHLSSLPPQLRMGEDVEELPAWGLDCYTHRWEADLSKALQVCLWAFRATAV